MTWVFLSAEGEVVWRENDNDVQEGVTAEEMLEWYNNDYLSWNDDFVEAVKVIKE